MIYEIAERRYMRSSQCWALHLVSRETGEPARPAAGSVVVDQVGRRFHVRNTVAAVSMGPGIVLVRAEDRAFDHGPSKDIVTDA